MMIFKKLLVVAIVAALFTASGVSFAQSSSQESLTRLNVLVQTQNITADDATKASTQSKCQDVQNTLKSAKQREQKIAKDRIMTYQDIQNQVLALEIRLKRQGVEINGIGNTLLQYQKLLSTYNTQTDEYQQALGDTASINCQENPLAFIAGVALTRQKRADLLVTTNAIQEFVVNNIFSELNKVKQNLNI